MWQPYNDEVSHSPRAVSLGPIEGEYTGSVANPEQVRESSRCTVQPLCGEQLELLRK